MIASEKTVMNKFVHQGHCNNSIYQDLQQAGKIDEDTILQDENTANTEIPQDGNTSETNTQRNVDLTKVQDESVLETNTSTRNSEIPGNIGNEVKVNENKDFLYEKLEGGVRMGEGYNKELRQGPSGCGNLEENCAECCGILGSEELRENFGITKSIDPLDPDLVCDCHDICVQEVRLICPTEVDCIIQIPGMTGEAIGCRGERVIVDPDGECKVIVTCVDEQLGEDCKSVTARVGLMFLFGPPQNATASSLWTPSFVMERILEFTWTEFTKFPEGPTISGYDLRREIKKIDGSCTVVDVDCEILPPDPPQYPNPRLRVYGNIIEKLWKHENLWVTGLRPYDGITVKQEFPEPHLIEPCTPEEPECPISQDVNNNSPSSS